MAYIPGYGYGGSPYWQFIDANGNPLSNGKVATYIAGTTTAYNTLKDWNSTYNGVVFDLDIRGGCTMIWPTTQLIKIIVKDVDGNIFKTLDNIGSGTAEDPITVFPDVSDNQNIWYLDTVNGLDTNSGLSRSAPKKTGDAVVIACKTAGKTTGRLVVMAGSSGVVFNATTWSTIIFPFFDVVCESFNTDIVWNAVNSSVRLQHIGGAHRFNGCNLSGSISMKCRTVVASGGDWNGEININAGDIFVDGLRCWGMSFFVTPFMHVQSTFMLGGEALIQALKINGAGSIYSYNDEAIKLEIQSTKFELEGQLSFPSQQGFSSFKISTMSMKRAATTSLLYLGAYAGVTVNYQLVVDTMGSIVPMEIANPAGTVAGKVIELLKYENKVDAEIIRATAAEALKANKLTTVNNSTDTAYTFLASDANTCHIVNTSAATTRTVPSDTTAPDIAIGDSIEVQNIGTGVVTFVAASGVTIRSSLTLVMYGQYSVCMLRKIAANTWILTGERTAV